MGMDATSAEALQAVRTVPTDPIGPIKTGALVSSLPAHPRHLVKLKGTLYVLYV